MESLNKIRFNHISGTIDEALGLSEGEGSAIRERVFEISGQTTTVSATIEKVIDEFSGGHLAFALFTVGRTADKLASPMSMLASLLSGAAESCDCDDCKRERGEI